MRTLALAVLSFLASACATAPLSQSPGSPLGAVRSPDRPQNVVLLIADGFGPASATLGRVA